jgi:hypothetical protein
MVETVSSQRNWTRRKTKEVQSFADALLVGGKNSELCCEILNHSILVFNGDIELNINPSTIDLILIVEYLKLDLFVIFKTF